MLRVRRNSTGNSQEQQLREMESKDPDDLVTSRVYEQPLRQVQKAESYQYNTMKTYKKLDYHQNHHQVNFYVNIEQQIGREDTGNVETSFAHYTSLPWRHLSLQSGGSMEQMGSSQGTALTEQQKEREEPSAL
ncbi:hypothetical protein MG293_017559 [Ovis ammon polii]|uniref:Uncharacterized protein n=1 Tax=Ovis ammon polii TaxID=230172 RepID=A0AAD4TU33_OVIAM|nr:hypothetical protein MG293_017559 [Ovis ammon polii]